MLYGDFEPIEQVKVRNGKQFEWRASKRTQREAIIRLLSRHAVTDYRLIWKPTTVAIVYQD